MHGIVSHSQGLEHVRSNCREGVNSYSLVRCVSVCACVLLSITESQSKSVSWGALTLTVPAGTQTRADALPRLSGAAAAAVTGLSV